LEWLTPSSLKSLGPYSSTLSVLLNEEGGIIDDTVITKHDDKKFYVVTNAGRRDRDLAWFRQKIEEWNASNEEKVQLEVSEEWGLLALQGQPPRVRVKPSSHTSHSFQGPKAADYLQALTNFDLNKLTFGKSAYAQLQGVNCHVARGGYTGEDGFEVSLYQSETSHSSHTICVTVGIDSSRGRRLNRKTPVSRPGQVNWPRCTR
jgi:aminomethyltransferase